MKVLATVLIVGLGLVLMAGQLTYGTSDFTTGHNQNDNHGYPSFEYSSHEHDHEHDLDVHNHEHESLYGLFHSTEEHEEDYTFDDDEDYGLQIGNLAPDFTLPTLNGETLKLSDFRGKRVLLNFWASWCGPCKEEMPHMQNVYEKYQDENIEIIAVNLTYGRETLERVESFVETYGITFPIPLDEEGEVRKLYQIIPIPTSYFIDEKGYIQTKYLGPMDESFIINEFNK